MVCLHEEDPVQTTIRDVININSDKSVSNIFLKSNSSVESIFNEVGNIYNYSPDEIELIIQDNTGKTIVLNEHKDKTLEEIGVICNRNIRNTIVISTLKTNKNMSLCVNNDLNEDDLLLGASASPTTNEATDTVTTTTTTDLSDPPRFKFSAMEFDKKFNYGILTEYQDDNNFPNIPGYNIKSQTISDTINYVGLVNQAMTCYLNSLLQTLFMTPEFRNALYKWEFDGLNETRSIPYQLQKLFLNLQTSNKSAVETTDLTTSFGWQGSEAWHQHDIQELCRVMFDALERKFKDTEQANLINDLYEGKMLDYVKCLECGTEKSREDTFLDIPLPVRPFGSNVAYNSVEEALRAFVQPETLDGNNQYYCEKCNKKCDAHKGLKFTKFPYLLTLHLKRFDFDYNSMIRIKLNDKVTFPEILNLNSFIINMRTELDNQQLLDEKDCIVNNKCDDCSTTDSGSALDDESCQGSNDVSSTVNGQDDNCEDSDEGIDVSSVPSHNERDLKGPYIYELFSIMIHSGSASGGHYYAYIKDFDKNQWFCFNDQSVTRITEDDIRKTYGGGPQRSYYSGAYTSSINAYMLMYRQINKERNCFSMKIEQFPLHIQKLLQHMRNKEEQDRIMREKENNMIKLNVYCYHPLNNNLQDIRISMLIDSTLSEAASYAHQRFKLGRLVNLDDCRIVSYNKKHDCIDCSFDDSSEELRFCDIVNSRISIMHSDWMLEIKKPDAKFQIYKRGGINMKVYPINLDTEEIDDITFVRVNVDDTVRDLKCRLLDVLKLDLNTPIEIVQVMYYNEPKYLDNDNDLIKFDANCTDYKLYVANAVDDDSNKSFGDSKLQRIIERFSSVISLNVVLPDTDPGTLEILSIPSLETNQIFEKLEISTMEQRSDTNSPAMRVSPQPIGVSNNAGGELNNSVGGLCGDCFGDQSNSEDSSLSDSDRTLVGDAPECHALLSSSSDSPADQHMPSPMDPTEDFYNYDVLGIPSEEMNWDCDDNVAGHSQKCNHNNNNNKNLNYYFKLTSISNCVNGTDNNYNKFCHILVDKRMTLEMFKKYLEPIIKVPMDYFKVFRQYPNSDDEWNSLQDTLRSFKDDERLLIKLGRVLLKNEYNCKVYSLKLENNVEPTHFLFEHIVAKGQTVGHVKKEILLKVKKQHMIDIPYNKCRLREKCWKKPRKVYLDDQKFVDDINIGGNFEIYIQELNDVDKITSTNQTALFIKHWCPSTLTLQPVQEIVLETTTMEELKMKISEISQIPIENVDVALCATSFPCDMHLLDIHTELEWCPNVTQLGQWPVQADHGSTFFYRDNREALKELTPEEKKEINQKENTRLGRFTTKNYSPGRERALKIYLDTSPSKLDDNNCID